MKHILIIAAPFGFGPSSKALILAEYLRGRYRVTISSMGGAAEFLQANASEGIAIVPGLFRKTFPTRAQLSGFHAFIAVNQMPALQHLAALGLAERSAFVDSLAQWRAESEPARLPEGLLAHVVQDEFPEPASDRAAHPVNAVVTAPILWPDEVCLGMDERQGVLVHTGGMTLAASGDDPVGVITSGLIGPIIESIAGYGHDVTLLGNADILRCLTRTIEVQALGSVSPASAIQAIGKAKLLITTPGIGAIYEAMSKRTPIVLLPPINSTQLRHFRVLTGHGIAGVLDERARDALFGRLVSLPWQHQPAALLRIYEKNAANIVRMADSILDPFLANAGGCKLDDYLARLDALWASLSRVSPKETVLGALDRLS